MVSRALFIIALLTVFVFPTQSFAKDLNSLGPPITGMHGVYPCWKKDELTDLLDADNFYLLSQGLLSARIDPQQPAIVIYRNNLYDFIILITRPQNNMSCVVAVGSDLGSL